MEMGKGLITEEPWRGLARGDSPTEHEDGAGGGVVGQREGLLQAQLLAAAVEAVGAVDAFGVVVAAGAVLHGPQVLGALHRQDTWERHLCVLPHLGAHTAIKSQASVGQNITALCVCSLFLQNAEKSSATQK